MQGVRATDPRPRDEDRKTTLRYLRFAAAGTQFALVMSLFTLGGVWLDSKVESVRPLFTILGALLGMAGATVGLVLQVLGPRKP